MQDPSLYNAVQEPNLSWKYKTNPKKMSQETAPKPCPIIHSGKQQ